MMNCPDAAFISIPPRDLVQPRIVRAYRSRHRPEMNSKTPLGRRGGSSKQERADDYPPKSVRLEHEAKVIHAAFIPRGSGPDRSRVLPSLRSACGFLLIHEANHPRGVGMQGAHRLHPRVSRRTSPS